MQEWTSTQIANRFEECISTLRKLPAGRRLDTVNYWPEIIYNKSELFFQVPAPVHLQAMPEQITRMDEALSWLVWVNQAERQLIWLRAERIPWREISYRTGFPKTSAQRYHQVGLLKIAQQLICMDGVKKQTLTSVHSHHHDGP